jgi:hypothetical protein
VNSFDLVISSSKQYAGSEPIGTLLSFGVLESELSEMIEQ